MSETKWSSFVAGGFGGAMGALVTCPLEVIKTRLQAEHNRHLLAAGRRGTRLGLGIISSIRDIYLTEGLFALWRGTGPFLLAVIPSRAIYFGTYDHTKRFLEYSYGTGRSDVNFAAAATAGATVVTVTCPIWLIKTRMQLQTSPTVASSITSSATTSSVANLHSYTSTWDCVKQTYKHEGYRGFYKGLGASYLGIAESSIQLVLYERIKTLIQEYHFKRSLEHESLAKALVSDKVPLTKLEYLFTASISKVIACVLTYPHEVIRTRLREERGVNKTTLKYGGIFNAIKVIAREEGFRGLYGGMGTHMIRVVPNAGILFLTYETVSAYLNNS